MQRYRQSGFTLLEVLAVIAILGITLAAVSLTVGRGGPESQVTEKIEQFMAVSEFAADRAVLTGEPMGLLLEPPQWQSEDEFEWSKLGWRYRWRAGGLGGWQDVPELKALTFDPETELTVMIDELRWRWEELLDRSMPVTAYYPTGDLADIEIIITDKRLPGYEQTIHVNDYGQLEWEELAEQLKAQKDAAR